MQYLPWTTSWSFSFLCEFRDHSLSSLTSGVTCDHSLPSSSLGVIVSPLSYALWCRLVYQSNPKHEVFYRSDFGQPSCPYPSGNSVFAGLSLVTRPVVKVSNGEGFSYRHQTLKPDLWRLDPSVFLTLNMIVLSHSLLVRPGPWKAKEFQYSIF